MNNHQLNKEFTQMIKDRKKLQHKSGFTDSEEEESSHSLKSPKSGRSTLSPRSSLLSGRSPRDEMPSIQRGPPLRNIDQRRYSAERSEGENDFSSPRKPTRFPSNEKSLSPKSPRNHDDSFSKYPRFPRNPTKDDDDTYNSKSNPITPRSPHSGRSDKDDLGGLDMMRTMRKPLSNPMENTISRREALLNEGENFQVQKQRAATPTKLGLSQRFQGGLNAKTSFAQRRMQLGSKFDKDLEEEELSRSGKTTPSRSGSRQLTLQNDDDDVDELTKNSRSNSPRNLRSKSGSPVSLSRSHSDPHDSLDIDKRFSPMNNLTNPKLQKSESSDSQKMKMEKIPSFKKESFERTTEKDPEVVETVEDKHITEKLQKEREQKRKLRETRTKNMTETTRNLEDAIEKVENEMQDSLRLKQLKEISNELKYSTKPSLEDMLKNERLSRSRTMSAKGRDNSRTRSLSSSARYENTLNKKYANVKPKTQTRLQIQSARGLNDSTSKLNTSQNDVMNDSASIRQNIYTEWYQKKMLAAQQQLKEAKLRQKDGEEKKAQELIEKLQKSKVIFKMWSEKKEESLKEKRRVIKTTEKKELEKELDKKEKKKEAEIAFREWLRKKMESDKEKKEEELEKTRKLEKEKRKEKENQKKPPKPPVPFDAWSKKKEDEIKEKQRSKEEIERRKRLEEAEKEKRKELAEKSYYEWLDKKDSDELRSSKALSTYMSSLPPFYPSSKTIPFGR